MHDLLVSGSRAPESWQTIGHFKAGVALYSDGGPTIAGFASRLGDSDWLRAPQADAANPELTVVFGVEDYVEVHVAMDARLTSLPAWMKDWISSRGWTLDTSDDSDRGYVFWKKRFEPGDTVRLGPNGQLPKGEPARMYATVIRFVRPAFTLQTEDQSNAGDLRSSQLSGYTGTGYVDLQTAKDASFTFFFEVGVGDRYGLNFRYQSCTQEPVPLHVIIRNTADGVIVCEDDYTFDPAGKDIWSTLRERTCESTNAGIYAIELSGPGIRDLRFDSLEIE